MANDNAIPSGWKIPGPNDLPDKWHGKMQSSFSKVVADFNGDGISDTAQILIKEQGDGVSLIVFISENENIEAIVLDQLEGSNWKIIMGIAEVLPGKYITMCGKGYHKCQEDESEEITLTNSGIDYFMSEGANSFYYWDKEQKDFKRTWISD